MQRSTSASCAAPPDAAWRRSRRCSTSACVEVAQDADGIWVRSSLAPEDVVRLTREEWDAFAAGVKDGEFDGLA